MPQIIPIKDLKNTSQISDMCHKSDEPIYITKNGYGDMVVMSIKTYEAIVQTAQMDMAIREAEDEFAKGGENLLDAREALTSLRRKYFG